MGRGNHPKVTVCMQREVHHQYPDIDGNYRRFRNAPSGEEENNDDDNDDENEIEANQEDEEEDQPVEYLLHPNVVLLDTKPITD